LIGQNTSRKGEGEMNKVNWEIISKGDFGPIKLGMTKPEINAILGDDVFHRNMIPHLGLAGDNYGRKNAIIHYCIRNGVKEAVYIEVNYPFKVLYAGKDLMRMSLADAKLHCEKNGTRIENIEARPGLWFEVCLSKGIGIYSSSASNRHLNSVFMFSDGYYERCDEYWRGYKRQLIMEVQELKFQKAKDKGELG
jgi:hypothetical protein